jgi:aldehyde dehydrogenase (NAD+)
MNRFESILSGQKQFYNTHITRDPAFRKSQLKKLYFIIQSNEKEILQALNKDFRKSRFEAYGTEIGLVLSEISYLLRNLKKLVSPRRASGNLLDFLSTAKIYPEPIGQVLILAPWNYPFQLVMTPLAGAISAGNTIIIKPSEMASATSAIIHSIISENFSKEYICCIKGGKEEAKDLLDLKFDFIFFTGSEKVGRIIMEAAAKNLSRVCLELGGKCPCIIDKTANIDLSCRRIVWGKFLNAGQTCVAPDYLLVQRDVAPAIKAGLKKYIIQFYSEDPRLSDDYPRIINLTHYRRITSFIDPEKIFFGGQTDVKELYISPTIMENITSEDRIMKQEIFGPVLPVIEYSNTEEIAGIVNNFPKPLSLYIFSRNNKLIKKLIREIEAGNANLNDTTMQFVNKSLSFGGKGSSGMGSYHGKYSFECFSHMKSVNRKSLLIDIPLRYPPYNLRKFWILKKLLK